MAELWEFFENLNELLYVADMDTHELIYMNKRGREIYDIPSQESFKGQKCYQVLQGCSAPCSICTNALLKSGEFHEWNYFNPFVKRHFALKDTMILQNGKRYRMELALDITPQETEQQFAANEAMLNKGLHLALSAPTPEASLNVLLQYVGQSLSSERIYIVEETPDHIFRNTYEWCAHGIIPQKEFLQNVPYETVAHWYESFRKNKNIIISDIEKIRDTDPLAYETLLPQKIHSLVVSPLIFQKQILGFYGVDNPPAELLSHISAFFEVLGHFIVSILRRRDLVQRLELLSYTDQLTGALNRHKMNDFVANVHSQESIGILYCDVLGLKAINDAMGHLEGDALLIRSCQCLQEHFPKDSVFRIGGDEFLVMISSISEEDFLQRIQNLQANMPDYALNMSLGWVWRAKCGSQITHLIKEADSKMYEEKRCYYEKHSRRRSD